MSRPVAIEDIYPLSPLQNGMLFHTLFEPDSAVYCEQLTCELHGALDEEAFARAWRLLVERHPILRTAFVWKGQREPVQVVHRTLELPWRKEDWRALDPVTRRERVEAFLTEDRRRGFEPNRAPLMRIATLRLAEDIWQFVLSHHHLLLDGWSFPILLREFAEAYGAFCAGRTPVLPACRPYSSYLAWLQKRDSRGAEPFWREELRGFTAPTPLAIDRPSRGGGEYAAIESWLSREETSRLKATARELGVTVNTLVQGAYAVVLSRYSGADDVLFGISVAGRPADLPGVETIVGLFINTLPFRVRVPVQAEDEVAPWLRGLQERQFAILDYHYSALSDIQGWSEVPRGQPLFESLLTFENYPVDTALPPRLGGLEPRAVRFVEFNNYPLTVIGLPGDRLGLKASFDTARLERDAVERMLGHLKCVLAGFVTPGARWDGIAILTPSERATLLGPPAVSVREDLRDGSLHAWFARQASTTPRAVAVTAPSGTLTYEQLDRASNRVARRLRALGIGHGALVGLLAERDAPLIVGALGILKAGGAYVPLDPSFPDERLAFMVADSRPAVVVTQRALGRRVGGACARLELDDDTNGLSVQSDAPLDGEPDPGAPAYVIYTSGSTGYSKGCVITHRNVLRLFTSTEPWFKFGPADVWTFFHSAAFDFSVWEIWGALLYGGRLVAVPYLTSREPAAFREVLTRERVTVLNQTPSAFRQLIEAEERQPGAHPIALRLVILGGEALELASLRPWFARHGDERPRLINMYGITETTVHVTYRPLRYADALEPRGSLIGVPIPDLRVLVLDARGDLAPAGVPGELCVAGPGLAQGYLDRPELTAQRFVKDPFGVASDGRLYRTGDLARRLPDGDIEYLGRIDDQVKIRGFRVELGEIESALNAHPAVRSAVVLAQENSPGEKRLTAYVVARDGARPSVDALRAHLQRRLLDCMVPSAFVWLDALPLTPNGKVDRRALPQSNKARHDDAAPGYVAPRDERESALAEIWRQVLGVERVGVRDNYFALGGDSIRSIRICARARECGFQISLQDLFEKQTIEALLAGPAAPNADGDGSPALSGPFSLISAEARNELPDEIEDAYPLTCLQLGMLFHSDAAAGATAYHDVLSHHLRGPLHRFALQAAVDGLVRRHAALRTSFDLTARPQPLQRVHVDAHLPVEWTDISGLMPADQDAVIDGWIKAEGTEAFDWSRPPLMRVHVHRRGEQEFQFGVCVHHAILDGWSMARLQAELFNDYLHRIGLGGSAPAAPPAVTFRDCVALERAAMEDQKSREFWARALVGAPILSLPRPEVTPAGTEAVYMHLPVHVTADTTTGLVRLAERLGVPLKTLLLAAHVRVLSLLGGQDDVVTGLVTSCRPEEPGAERIAGLFLNTLPLRVRLPRGDWTELVRAIFRAEKAMLPHRRVPLSHIQKCLGGAPLFETDFNFVHFHIYDALRGLNALERVDTRAREETNFTLAVNFGFDGHTGVLSGSLSMHLRALDRRLAAGLPELYGAALAAVVAMPERPWRAASLTAGADRERALRTWNDTATGFVADGLLHQLFEKQAGRTPDAVAVIDAAGCLTYAELDLRGNQLAHWLRRRGVAPGARVGVALERSTSLVVALLGILKSGAAYLPIDPAYPAERIAWMINDGGTNLVLAGRTLPGNNHPGTVCWADLWPETAAEARGRPDVRMHPESAAYVVYTSGSTGVPKGVVVPHRAIVNHMLWMQRAFPLGGDDAVLQKTPTSFDAAVWEFWAPLLAGARLVMAQPGEHSDPAYLVEAVQAHGITTVQFVPSVLDLFLDSVPDGGCPCLRRVFSGGEVLRPETRDRFSRRLAATLINLYGPTEAAIDATFWVCDREEDGVVPIGRPIANVQAYILDAQLEPVPPGVVGELYLGGTGLAHGYLHRPELTAERFLPDPFSARPGARLYRTGDLARHRSDGAILYAGRADAQVKVRGHRVEPGEIEATLANHPAVARAVVIPYTEGPGYTRLAAYVVRRPHPPVDAGSLLAFLRGQLPEALVPAAVVFLNTLPLTPNGKLDRQALPAPASANLQRTLDHRALPVTPVEQEFAAIWRDVLGVDLLSVHDNFFELGGDSIQSLRFVSLARRSGWKIRPKEVFDHPTVAELARVAQRVGSPPVPGSAAFDPEDIPLTPIQREFFALEAPNPHHWNQAVLVQTRPGLSPALVARAWEEVVRQHAAFRLRFVRVGSGWRQRLVSGVNAPAPPFRVVNLAGRPPAEQVAELARACRKAQTGLDLVSGPVASAVFFEYGDASAGRLLLVAHHLCIDAVSWRILLEDLASTCAGPARPGAARTLPEDLSFPAWAARLPQIATSAETHKEAAFWLAVTSGSPTPLALDFAEGRRFNFERATGSVTSALPAHETARLLREVPTLCRTRIDELLLAALHAALQEWTACGESLIDLEGHGREESFVEADLARAVGWFTSLFPVRLGGEPHDATLVRLRRVKEALRTVPRRGIGYGLLRHLSDDMATAAALSDGARPDVSFNYLGQVSVDGDGEGEGADAGPFRAAPESPGPERAPDSPRAHLLDVVAMVAEGCLRLQWLYCERAHRRETIERIARRFDAELRALLENAGSDVAQALIPADFPLAQLSQPELVRLCAARAGIEDIWPLTPLQEGMLVHALHDGEPGIYGQQIAVDLRGALDLEALARAWREVGRRHATLRVEFAWEDLPAPRQFVRREVPVEVQSLDWSALTPGEQAERWENWLTSDRRRGFDLQTAPLWRVTVISLGEGRWRMVWSHHHLLLDGWSVPVVFRDLLSAYAASAGAGAGPAAPSPSYRRYLEWLAQTRPDAAESFWRKYLAGYKPPPALEIGPAPGGARQSSSGQRSVRVDLNAQAWAALKEYTQRHQLTLSTCVQGAWAYALTRWLGTDEVVFGLVVAGRPLELPGAEAMVGLFINTLPVRVSLRRTERVGAWLHRLQEEVAALREFEHSALVDVHGWSGVPRSQPLFESIIIFENYPLDPALGSSQAGLEVGMIESFERTNFPLNLYVLPGESLTLRIDYACSRFEDEVIAALLDQVVWLLESLPGRAHDPVTTLKLLRPGEAHKVTTVWNQTLRAAWDRRPVHERISARAAAQPEAPAVTGAGRTLSYGELDAQSNRLARYLRTLGAGPGGLVGVCLDRSPELSVALLGVLKSGAAYVPLDPSFPPERLAMMQADSGLKVAVTQAAFTGSAAGLFQPAVTCVRLDADAAAIAAQPAEPLEVNIPPAGLAYVIFTSGSTGRPKGVMVTHAGLANFLSHFAAVPGLDRNDVLLAVTTLSFDIAGLEIFLPLTRGARVAVARRETAVDASRLAEELDASGATVMQATPATWRLLLTGEWRPRRPFQAWCGGETLPVDLATALLARGCRLWNFYGPTETTIWSAVQPVVAPDDARSIGRPIAHTTAYILDADLNPVPPGVAGELYLGGEGLARGYLGQPGMTAERFRPDPFARNGARLYATGDLARFRPDGCIEFLGRRDQQVKIRGFRIELGEVEAALRAYPGVQDAVVAAREDRPGEKRLVAYVVGATKTAGWVAAIRDHLHARLPDFMIPAAFVPLTALPVTPNGKLDRRALPCPEPEMAPAAGYVAPRNPLEQVLADLWRELLGTERIGAHDHFFELGGHSLLAAQALARIRKLFQVDLPLRTFFQTGTPEQVSIALTAREPAPGRLLKIAGVLLKLRAMSPEERLRLRERKSSPATPLSTAG